MLKYKTKYYNFDEEAVASLKKAADNDEIPETYEIKARYTDDQADSHNDIITRSATEKALPDYRKWRNIRYMHQPKAVGIAKHIGTDDGADLEWNETIVKLVDKDTIHQVREGVLKGLSVGILFNPFDSDAVEVMENGAWKIKDYVLAEISVVDHPANPNASIVEAALSSVDGEISTITDDLKSAVRSATTSEELVPLLKSLTVEKENNMEELNKEGRDWESEESSPEENTQNVPGLPDTQVSEEEDVEEVEEELEDEVEEELEDEEVEEVEDVEDIEEEELEEEVEEVEEEEEEEVEVEEEEVVEEEEEVTEEVEEEEIEEEEELEEEEIESESEEEVEESEEEEVEEPSESNEEEEYSIEVNEGNSLSNEQINKRLERVEALLTKLLGEDPETIQAEEAVAEADTDSVSESENKDVADTELSTPSNRKTNVDVGENVSEKSEDGEDAERLTTLRRKELTLQHALEKLWNNLYKPSKE